MNITMKRTTYDDLKNVQSLWDCPEVMHFVGFPDGLHRTLEELETRWLPWVQQFPQRQHYSIYADGIGYCGESFYDVDETGLACMDIKLLPDTRGKGIASFALSHALDHAFLIGCANRAYVDPNPENTAAMRLYRTLGFRETERADHLEDPGCPYIYMEVQRQDWQEIRGIRYGKICLRDMRDPDIADWIRWNTVRTEWMDWDGPDLQPEVMFDEDAFLQESRQALALAHQEWNTFYELATADGMHIGMVSSYATDAAFQHITWQQAREKDAFWFTLGIVICENDLWSHGLGTQALAAFCRHFENHGHTNLRLQTWSGNIRMVRCAERVGFVECNRFVGNRFIRGGIYDGLTFQLDLDRFHKYLADNA